MIPEEVKRKLLSELEKSGNIYFACNKTGVDRSTFYRWKKEDQSFRKSADQAVRSGRENMCDLAEHALLLNVKDKKMEAIKYVLSHNSPTYRPKRTSRVILEHRSDKQAAKEVPNRTLEDLIMESEDRMTAEYYRSLGDQNKGEPSKS